MTWWRFFGTTFCFLKLSQHYRIFVATLMIPCNDKYRYPHPANDNTIEWSYPPFPEGS